MLYPNSVVCQWGEISTMSPAKVIFWQEVVVTNENCHKMFWQFVLIMRWWLIKSMIYAHFQYRVNNSIVSWVANLLVSGTTFYRHIRTKMKNGSFLLLFLMTGRLGYPSLAGLYLLLTSIFNEACQWNKAKTLTKALFSFHPLQNNWNLRIRGTFPGSSWKMTILRTNSARWNACMG